MLSEGLRFADRERFTYAYGYFLPWKDAMAADLEAQGAEVTCFPARNAASILLAAGRVAMHLRNWRADLLHCHLPVAGVVGRIAGQLARVPVVYTEHNTMERYHPVSRWLNRTTWPLQKRVIAVSGEVAASLATRVSAHVPVDVVMNGIDVDRFRRTLTDSNAVRRQLRIPLEVPVVGTVAVFGPKKRLDDWLLTAKLLSERRPTTHFLLVGDGLQRRDLMALASTLGLEGRVHFPGLQDDVRPYLAAMDVYLMSSMFEGLPIALLEAMSMQCAVVATAVGGIPEVIRHGETGFLVEAGQPASAARVVDRLLASPEVLQRVAEAGRRTVQERFSIRRVARELENIYLAALG
jgi:L-malate glycosyltransferase